jgi:homoserine dehydrogenase
MSIETMHAPRASALLRRVDLVLIGARGQVGSALRRQLARQERTLRHEGLDLRLLAAFDRRGFAFDADGLVSDQTTARMRPREAGDCDRLLGRLHETRGHPAIVIDCTASDDIADLYAGLLGNSVGVVTANKRANARDLTTYLDLQRLARERRVPYRYETTVGAAIPLLGPLRDLRLRGERVRTIQGVLSGSLSYILHRLHEGCAFSAAVGEARAMGYTEPNPLEDLRAIDLARKVLVLAREAGFMLEEDALSVEPLSTLDDVAPDALIDVVRAEDALWAERIAEAHSRGERCVVIAEVDETGGRIACRSLPGDDAFAQLAPGQNLVTIRTELQDLVPLRVSGAGAGVEITAAGMLSDIVAAARGMS